MEDKGGKKKEWRKGGKWCVGHTFVEAASGWARQDRRFQFDQCLEMSAPPFLFSPPRSFVALPFVALQLAVPRYRQLKALGYNPVVAFHNADRAGRDAQARTGLLCFVVFCCVLLCFVVFCCVLLRFVVLCCVLLCVVVFCCVLLCFLLRAICAGSAQAEFSSGRDPFFKNHFQKSIFTSTYFRPCAC